MQTPINRRIDIFFSLVGCALFVASGALIIEAYLNAYKGDARDKQLTKASISFINGAIFLVDALLNLNIKSIKNLDLDINLYI